MKGKRTNALLLKSVAERLKRLRQERGLTQEKVTDHTGVNIGLIELGRTNISISTLVLLCNYYEVSLQDFVTGVEYDRS